MRKVINFFVKIMILTVHGHRLHTNIHALRDLTHRQTSLHALVISVHGRSTRILILVLYKDHASSDSKLSKNTKIQTT